MDDDTQSILPLGEYAFLGRLFLHKFASTIGDVYCGGERREAWRLIAEFLWYIAKEPNIDIWREAEDGSQEQLPPWSDDRGESIIEMAEMLRTPAYGVGISFTDAYSAEDDESARDQAMDAIAGARYDHSEGESPAEKEARSKLGITRALCIIRALRRLSEPLPSVLSDLEIDSDDQHWFHADDPLWCGDVVDLFAELLDLTRIGAAGTILDITDGDSAGFFAPCPNSQTLRDFFSRRNKPSGESGEGSCGSVE